MKATFFVCANNRALIIIVNIVCGNRKLKFRLGPHKRRQLDENRIQSSNDSAHHFSVDNYVDTYTVEGIGSRQITKVKEIKWVIT